MEMNDIIEKFDEDERVFAKEAVLEAKKHKGEINDYLLECLDDFAKKLKKYEDKMCPMRVIYAIYLLAEFEDKRLFPILIKIFGDEQYDASKIVGDGIVDNLKSILVSVFDGDFEAINDIIENEKIDDYVRSEFLRCYLYFYENNMIESEELEKYLVKLIELYEYNDDYIYNTIMEVIINAHLFTMIEEVKKMFDHGVIDMMIRGGYDDFIDYIFDYEHTFDKFGKIEDTIEEMSWWACFHDEDDELNMEKLDDAFSEMVDRSLSELKTTSTKVGRNEPCPCGSGKKYKKCCIDKKILTLPYQSFIEKSLSKYPKKKDNDEQYDLYDFYKEEYIEIDKLLYKALKYKAIPVFIERDYNKENEINLAYFKEALHLMKNLVEKEKFKTLDDYDDKVSIHYSIYQFFEKYSNLLLDLLDNSFSSKRYEYIGDLKDLLDFFYSNFDLNNRYEIIFLNVKHSLYTLEDEIDEGIEYFEKRLKNCLSSIKYYVYECLFNLYSYKDDGISKMEKYIEKEKDEELKDYLEELKFEYEDY